MMPTDHQFNLMMHALGISDQSPKGYRNYFAAAPGSKDHAEWETLEKAGLAQNHGSDQKNYGDLIFYTVSLTGEIMTKSRFENNQTKEKDAMSRSKRRYQAYLKSEANETFYEWLKNKYWDDYRKRAGC